MNNETMNKENENVVVEKVIRMIKEGSARFVYMDGKLQQIKRARVEFDMDKLEAVEWWSVGGGEPVILSHDMEFYASEEQFKAGKALGDDAFLDRKAVSILDCCSSPIQNGKAWVYEDGHAVEWDAAEHIHKVVLTNRYTAEGVEFPVLYRSADEVYRWNNYISKDDNGVTEEREGEYVPLIPEADQMPLVEKLKSVIEECREADMRIFWDSEDGTLGIVNFRRVKDWGYCRELDIDEEQGERTIPLMFHRDCYLKCGSMCCDDELLIRKK